MSNKFYRAPGEESDDEEDNSQHSGSEGEEDGSESEEEVKPKVVAKPKAKKPAAEDSDNEDNEKHKLLSAKEKKMSALMASMKAANNARKIGNWVKVLAEWDSTEVHLAKLMKEPEFRKEVPKVYWQNLLAIEGAIRSQKDDEKKAKAGADEDETDAGADVKGAAPAKKAAAAPKKMNAEQARAQTRLHSNLKKLLKTHEKAIAEYKKNPLPDVAEAEDKKSKKKQKEAKDGSDVESDDEEGEGEDEESDKSEKEEEDDDDEWDESDSDDEVEAIDLSRPVGKMFTREYWMKKPGAPDSDDESTKVKGPKTKRKQGPTRVVSDAVPTSAEKKKEEVDWTPEVIHKKLAELVGMRGKKGTDRQAVVSDLKLLATKTTQPAPLLKVYVTLASALFDITLNADVHMPVALWRESHAVLVSIVDILEKEPLVRLSEDDTSVEESFETGENEDQKIIERYITSASTEKVEEEKKKKAEEEKNLKEAGKEMQYVMGNLYSFVDRMAAEYKKSLQNLDAHGAEYLARLKEEPMLVSLIDKVAAYYEKIDKTVFRCKITLLRLEHTYYQYSPAHDVQRAEAVKAKADSKTTASAAAAPAPASTAAAVKTPFGSRAFLSLENPTAVQTLATFLYKHADDRSRMRALLFHVYHLAIHNRYAEARDLLLMSHVQDSINDVDIYTRIVFNRTMAQLGLCAFRVGEYRQALYCLTDLHQSKNLKELIAQGTSSRFFDRDLEKEKAEKKRLYPYHMHMSLDMLEAVHLLSAMFVEVPNIAVHGADNKRRIISKSFRRLFDHHQRQAFNGPPENTRDLIMGATKALRSGEWQKALKYTMRLKMWEVVPNADFVKTMVTDKLKEEALRTYLFTFATQYQTISLHTLMATFELAANVVYRITSKMMVNEQLQGTWDQPTACIVMHAHEHTPLQRAALKYSDKVALFLEQNERVAETRAAIGLGGDGEGRRAGTGYGGYGSGYQRAGGNDGGDGGDNNAHNNRGGRDGRYRPRGGGGGRLGGRTGGRGSSRRPPQPSAAANARDD